MTPERMAGLVARWVRLYTRNVPATVAERRIAEIDADVHDHIAHDRAEGTADRRIARAVVARMIRGLAADLSWRAAHSPSRKDTMSKSTRRSLLRVGVPTGFIVLLPLVAMQFSDGVDWGVADFVLAGVLVGGTGLLLEVATRRPAAIVYRVAAAAIGVVAILLGEEDDAPGLVLFGLMLLLGTAALTLRTARRSE
jgi:hypothetical protein